MAKTYTTLKNVRDAENWDQVNHRNIFGCKLYSDRNILKDEEAIFMEDLAAVYTYVEDQIR